MIHKVLQEGHPNTLKDGYRNRDFIASWQQFSLVMEVLMGD